MNWQINLAVALWQNWQEKEKMLLDVFGHGSLAENLNREKYDFLLQGINRISRDVTPDEKLVLGLIRKSMLRLEKQLYPNPVLRVLHRLKNIVFDRSLRDAKLKAENVEAVSEKLDKLGLNPKAANLERQFATESQKLEIELLSPYGAGNYTVKLNLEKDAVGRYEMSGYTASLKDPLNPENSRSYTFPAELGIGVKEAVNLLQGRAVMKYEQAGLDRTTGKWLQLDFSSPGEKPLLRETNAEHEFNIRHEMIRVAVAFDKPELAGVKALSGLEQGNQVALKQVSGETIYLEANPMDKTITVRDESGQPVMLEKAVKKREKSLEVKQEIKLTKTCNRQKQQGQAIGIN